MAADTRYFVADIVIRIKRVTHSHAAGRRLYECPKERNWVTENLNGSVHASNKAGRGTDMEGGAEEFLVVEGVCAPPGTSDCSWPCPVPDCTPLLWPARPLPYPPCSFHKAKQRTVMHQQQPPSKHRGVSAHKNADRNQVCQMRSLVSIWHVESKINFSIFLPSVCLRICTQWATQNQ